LNDGVLTVFNAAFNNAVDASDATKLTTIAENISLKRDGHLLAIELRQPVVSQDSVFYNLSRLGTKNYRLQLIGKNMAQPGLMGYLIDTLLHTSTVINLDDTTNIEFTIPDAATAANSTGRFVVVFKQASSSPVPVTYTNIEAWQQDANANSITVKWQVANELNIAKYEIEKSSDGKNFAVIGTTKATGNNNASSAYTWLDANGSKGDNFYRIESISADGSIQYSQIVKVTISDKSGISIYPDPVVDGKVNVQLNNMPKGLYSLRILSADGKLMAASQIHHNGGNAAKVITISNYIAEGLYTLEVMNPDNSKSITTFITSKK
jgi:archaellum component FlaG (FlaF/FlaG flagellin family)